MLQGYFEMKYFFAGNNELVFINFYADWCRFSNILAPTWDETADKVKEAFPDDGRVVIGKVDCDAQCECSCLYLRLRLYTKLLLELNEKCKFDNRLNAGSVVGLLIF